MKKNKILLRVRGSIALILFLCMYFQPNNSGITGDCPPEYCKTYASASDCLCVYNKSNKCYCELLSGGGVNCHSSCTAPDVLPKEIEIPLRLLISIILSGLLSAIVILMILYTMRTVKLRKLFGKKGKRKRYALIPIRNIYIKSKITKNLKN